ncbi:bloodthirsty-related gene family, member 2 isoform 1-T2 [Spinachia spinachia]
MASTISLLPEKHFLCSLCQGIFTSPVTIPCGHSFCLSCLSLHWTRHQSKYCPSCRRLFSERPDLSVNRVLAEVSDNYRKTRPHSLPEEELVIDVEQMIQERQQKVVRMKSALELQKNSYLREVRESQKVFSTLVQAMEKNHRAVVDTIEGRKREEEKRVERLVKEIEKEIQELRKDSSEPDPNIPVKSDPDDDTNQVTVNIVPATRPCDMKDWSKVAIETDPCVGVTRQALEEIMEKIKVEVNRLSKSGE